jgi:lipopolysaccharide/colanic/teichoic acid biosynthesis glycosyltransferase
MTRLLDFLISSMVLIVLAPLLIIVMIILKLTGEHEAFYLQERVGKSGKSFKVIKFATMLKESPNLPGGFLTQQDDPRVLPVGKVLRKWKINELPQLFNVWIGEMSLVGPRPQARVHYDLYTPSQKAAIDTQKPGLTRLPGLSG